MPKRKPKKILYVRLYEEDGDIAAFIAESGCINRSAFVKSLIRLGIREKAKEPEKEK